MGAHLLVACDPADRLGVRQRARRVQHHQTPANRVPSPGYLVGARSDAFHRTVHRTLTGHTGPVTGITSFTHDGRTLLATTSWGATVRIWDPDTGGQVGEPLTGHTSPVSRITSFHPPRGPDPARHHQPGSDGADLGSGKGPTTAVLDLQHRMYAIASLNDELVEGLDDGWARIVLPAELGFERPRAVQTTPSPEGHSSPKPLHPGN